LDPRDVKCVVVVGAGVMGNSIAQVFARAGIKVGLVDLDNRVLERAMNLIKSDLKTLAGHGALTEDEIPSILEHIQTSTDLPTMAKGVDFALEVASETPDAKKDVFSQLEEFCPEDTVIASNTSGLDIFKIADLKKPENLVSAHWFTPAHIIPLVEIAPGQETSPEVVSFTAKLMERLGKSPVVLRKFVPSFIVNRIQRAIGDVVFEIVEKGWAEVEDIDRAVKASLGIRLPIVGVAQTYDFNGLDLLFNIQKNRGDLKPLIEEKVNQGHLGVKTSKGIYDYKGRSEEEILRKRDELYLKMVDHLKKIKAFEPV